MKRCTLIKVWCTRCNDIHLDNFSDVIDIIEQYLMSKNLTLII